MGWLVQSSMRKVSFDSRKKGSESARGLQWKEKRYNTNSLSPQCYVACHGVFWVGWNNGSGFLHTPKGASMQEIRQSLLAETCAILLSIQTCLLPLYILKRGIRLHSSKIAFFFFATRKKNKVVALFTFHIKKPGGFTFIYKMFNADIWCVK